MNIKQITYFMPIDSGELHIDFTSKHHIIYKQFQMLYRTRRMIVRFTGFYLEYVRGQTI